MCNNCQGRNIRELNFNGNDCNCNCNNNNDARESANCAIQDCCEIEGACQDILFETNHLRRNDSCEAIRIISRDIEEIEELTDCICEDIKDINSATNRERLNIIEKSICNIHKGINEIEEGLEDVHKNNVCGGVQEIRKGTMIVEDNTKTIQRVLRSIVFEEPCNNFLDINIRINKCC